MVSLAHLRWELRAIARPAVYGRRGTLQEQREICDDAGRRESGYSPWDESESCAEMSMYHLPSTLTKS
jgi:hypothetical protein